jgi:hypothetical protein
VRRGTRKTVWGGLDVVDGGRGTGERLRAEKLDCGWSVIAAGKRTVPALYLLWVWGTAQVMKQSVWCQYRTDTFGACRSKYLQSGYKTHKRMSAHYIIR